MGAPNDDDVEEFKYKRAARKQQSLVGWVIAGLRAAMAASAVNIYLYANVVYLAYSIGILIIDFYPWDPNNYPYDSINQQFQGWNWVHCVNSTMYIASWLQYGFPVLSVVHIPEIMNVVGSVLYLSSGYSYPFENIPTSDDDAWENSYNNDASKHVRRIELAASCLELLAAYGWAYTWWYAYERKPGRGWTMDDPDTWSNIFIILGAWIYIVYNCQVIINPSWYATYMLYSYGDICYFISAVFYVISAMRDCGWWFWLPLAGRWGYEMVPLENPLDFAYTRSATGIRVEVGEKDGLVRHTTD